MESQLFMLNEKETRAKKQWLIAAISIFVLYPLFSVGLLVVISQGLPNADHAIYAMLGLTLISLLPFFLVYRCAHKKPGTRLLTFYLVMAPLWMVSGGVKALSQSCDISTIGVVTMDIAIFMWWYLASLKLRKVNKKLQYQQIKCEEYLDSICDMKNASSLEELDARFSKLIQTWPQFEPASSAEYKSKKAILSQT